MHQLENRIRRNGRIITRSILAGLLMAVAISAFAKQHRTSAVSLVPPIATVTSVAAGWGIASAAFVNGAVLPAADINKLSITLSSAAELSAGDVSVTGIAVANYGPVTISGSGTSYTVTLAQPISTPDRVVMTVGNAEISTYTVQFGALPGDVNGDGIVNAQDLVLVHNAMSAPYSTHADINGDGVVNLTDYTLVRSKLGATLPAL